MTDKSERSYTEAFQYVKNNLFVNLTFRSCMSDYEYAIKNAVMQVFDGIKMLHCWFHYCQVIFFWYLYDLFFERGTNNSK